ncbi:MAG: hypothetical protein OEV10_08565 [Gammaproteobacteria bacterium]|jgi:hypothetical protein|nr:hypothetical protein [Gammaproteobacteria bacterium]NCF58259.1 hypothetical protein [Gammaproteobacteria bacterium]
MLKIVHARPFIWLAICALGVAACGKSTEEPEIASPLTDNSGLLRYVPADTPYVFGTVAPPPDEFMDRIEPKVDRLLKAQSEFLRVVASEVQTGDGEDSAEAEPIGAVMDELRSLMSLEGLREAGVTRDSTVILYGNGLLPVLRVALSDASLFEDLISRIEAEAGEQLPVAEVDGNPYRYVEDEGIRLVIATIGNEFVLTAAPESLDDAALARLLGLTLPAESIADSGKLRDIANEYGYLHEYVGLVDTVRLADTFIEEPEGLDARLLDIMGYDAGALSDVCKAELRSLAKIAPRVVAGYEEVSAGKIRSTTVVELRDDIAAEITAFAAPVPGLGRIYDGLFSLGMSLKAEAIRSFFDTHVAALRENPWECEHLADAQDGLFAASEQALAQPVPPVLYDFHGFLLVVEDMEGFDFGRKQPPESLDASFLLAIDNAQGLLAMGQAMIPQLAEMNIEPDGKARRFDLPEAEAGAESAWIALTDSAIALSVSEDGETVLPAMLKAEGVTPPPFMSMGLDGARYYTALAAAMREDDDEEMSEEMREALSDVMTVAADFYERLQIDVTFTDRGIEIDTDMSLAD